LLSDLAGKWEEKGTKPGKKGGWGHDDKSTEGAVGGLAKNFHFCLSRSQ